MINRPNHQLRASSPSSTLTDESAATERRLCRRSARSQLVPPFRSSVKSMRPRVAQSLFVGSFFQVRILVLFRACNSSCALTNQRGLWGKAEGTKAQRRKKKNSVAHQLCSTTQRRTQVSLRSSLSSLARGSRSSPCFCSAVRSPARASLLSALRPPARARAGGARRSLSPSLACAQGRTPERPRRASSARTLRDLFFSRIAKRAFPARRAAPRPARRPRFRRPREP